MDPANMNAIIQMQQAMQQLQGSGVMPGLNDGLGGPLGGGGAGQLQSMNDLR